MTSPPPRLAPARAVSAATNLLALALLVLASHAQAAEHRTEAPGDFRNGQDNDFGSIAMAPYLSAGDGSIPIEAHIVVRDLEAIEAAADVLFAFNVKGDAVRATVGSLRTADGKELRPLRTVTVDDGRQPQAHFAPADLLAVASAGRLDLVLSGRVEAKADTQAHVGAMVIAFDEGWSALPSGAGSAQLYGFTMVSALGVGGGAMPFRGQGNTLAVLPLALLALFFAMAGATAASMLARTPAALAAAEPPPATAAIPTFGQPSRPVASGGPAARPAASPLATAASSAASVPVFGGPASPAVPARPGAALAHPAVPPGRPRQGPRLPPHPLDRSPMVWADDAPAPPTPVVAEATATVPARAVRSARPARPARPAQRRPAARPKGGTAALTEAKRPNAKASGKAKPAPPTAADRPATEKGAAPQASRKPAAPASIRKAPAARAARYSNR